MAPAQLLVPGEIVKKSNALARARWSAESVWEPRLVAMLASKVQPDDTDFQVYEIPIAELIGKAEKVPSGRTYQELSVIVDSAMSRVITIKDGDKGGWIKYNVFSRCRYNPEKGTLELRFDPDLKPHYLNLQRNFAQYSLLEYLMLPSIYSQRIFEILKSWCDRPEVVIPLPELFDMLDVPESLRVNFKDFRRRVLEKAHQDIHSKTGFVFAWEPIKKGRGVSAVRFTFGKRLAAAKEKAKKDAQEAKRVGGSNAAFIEAFACAQAKAGACDGMDKAPAVCDICRDHRFLEEIRQKTLPPAPPVVPAEPERAQVWGRLPVSRQTDE